MTDLGVIGKFFGRFSGRHDDFALGWALTVEGVVYFYFLFE